MLGLSRSEVALSTFISSSTMTRVGSCNFVDMDLGRTTSSGSLVNSLTPMYVWRVGLDSLVILNTNGCGNSIPDSIKWWRISGGKLALSEYVGRLELVLSTFNVNTNIGWM